MQWEDVICASGCDKGAVANIILSALVLENGGSLTVSVMTLRDLQRDSRFSRLTAEVEAGQLVIRLVE